MDPVPWRGHTALHCKVCGGHRGEVGPLSARYKCASCGRRRERENADQLKAHRGPYFEAWRRGSHTAAVEGLVEIGYISETQKKRLIDEFDARSREISTRYEPSLGESDHIAAKEKHQERKRPPSSMTKHQRQVGSEIRQHYRKARGNIAQGLFLTMINMDMQRGVPRLEAEKRVVEYVRERYPGFSPLRA
jgi:hypothetical protein